MAEVAKTSNRGSAPGERRGGRQKGTPNKLTASVKAALVAAFDQLGGVDSLVKWGKKNPGAFYPLWAKMLPTEIKNADGESFRFTLGDEVSAAPSEVPYTRSSSTALPIG